MECPTERGIDARCSRSTSAGGGGVEILVDGLRRRVEEDGAVLGNDALEEPGVFEHVEELRQLAAGNHHEAQALGFGVLERLDGFVVDDAVVGNRAVVVGGQNLKSHRVLCSMSCACL